MGYLVGLTRKLGSLGVCLGECENWDYEGVFNLGECLEDCLWYVDIMSDGMCVFDLSESDVEEWCSSVNIGVIGRRDVIEGSTDPTSVSDEDDEDLNEVVKDEEDDNESKKMTANSDILNKGDDVEGYVSMEDLSVDEDGYLYYDGGHVTSETSDVDSGIVYVGMEDLVEDEDGYLYYPGSDEGEQEEVSKVFDYGEDTDDSDTEEDFPDTDYVEDESDTAELGIDDDYLFPEYENEDGYDEDADEEDLFPEYDSDDEVSVEVSEELSDDEFPENLDDDMEDADFDDVDPIGLDEDIPELSDEGESDGMDDDFGDDDDLFPAEEESWGQDDTDEKTVDLDSDDEDFDDDMFPDWGTDEEDDLDSLGSVGSVNLSTTENKSISPDPKNGKNGVRDPAKNGIEIGLKSGGKGDFSLKKAGSGFGESKSSTVGGTGESFGNGSFEILNESSRRNDNSIESKNMKPMRNSYENGRLDELERETRLFRNMDKAINGLLSFARKKSGKGVSKDRNSGVTGE